MSEEEFLFQALEAFQERESLAKYAKYVGRTRLRRCHGRRLHKFQAHWPGVTAFGEMIFTALACEVCRTARFRQAGISGLFEKWEPFNIPKGA